MKPMDAKSWKKLGVLAICVGAVTAGVCALSTRYMLTINLTQSLPGTVYVVSVGETVKKGDLVAFAWHGGVGFAAGMVFIKQVTGVEGDVSTLEGDVMYLGGNRVGEVLLKTRKGDALKAASPGLVPKGELFVSTGHPRSLDSRYAIVGNVKPKEFIGKAYAVF